MQLQCQGVGRTRYQTKAVTTGLSDISVNLSAALNQPVDTIANGEKRKAGTSNRSGSSSYMTGRICGRVMARRVFAIPVAITG